jgi:hypothetical protein
LHGSAPLCNSCAFVTSWTREKSQNIPKDRKKTAFAHSR